MPHRGENKRNSTLRCTKTGGIQPKLNVACFVQSCLTDADFVIFSNYCLIGTRPTVSFLFCQTLRAAAQGKTAVRGASRPAPRHGERNGFHGALPHDPRIARRAPAPTVRAAAPVRLPAEVLKLRTFSFLQSNSNFFCQLTEHKRERREGTAFP